MHQLTYITLLVDDYDKAIRFYTQKMNFVLVEDTPLTAEKRWVVIRPDGGGCGFLLAKAKGPQQETAIGAQSGGRVFAFLHTTNFDQDYQQFINNGVELIRERSEEVYGTVAVFADCYGNLFDLVGPKRHETT